MDLLASSCRVALAALVHDLGKFAQRANLPVREADRDLHIQLYCPRGREGRPTHLHAAYTGLFFDVVEKWAPYLRAGDQSPFHDADTLVNAASAHHAPDTLMQWILATADRAASGFERENRTGGEIEEKSTRGAHIKARQWSLFEEVRLDAPSDFKPKFRKPLAPLSVDALFPRPMGDVEDQAQAEAEYRKLWEAFVEAGDRIPKLCRKSWPLWIDAFDTLWLTYAQAVPSATAFGAKPDVSLYDHSKATAAFAAALWRWYLGSGRSGEALVKGLKDRTLWEEESLLLVQGDFFGIQNFIFSGAAQTDSKAAKILRGRSFYVSLLTEACALKVLEALQLPPTSQIINAAGKFLIVAPNTEETRCRIEALRAEIDRWFVENTCAEAGIGIAAEPARLSDFSQKHYPRLMKGIFASLEREKLQRLRLFDEKRRIDVLDADYGLGVCAWQGRWPADDFFDGLPTSAVTRDEIRVGNALVRSDLLLLVDGDAQFHAEGSAVELELPVFGYRAVFMRTDGFKHAARELSIEALRRVWDFSMPESESEVLWKGMARRSINGYVPRLPEEFDPAADPRWADAPAEDIGRERILPFSWIARADLIFDAEEEAQGVCALCHLKGDVDQLGRIFQEGLTDLPGSPRYGTPAARTMTFAKMATLSREINAFFSLAVPVLCRRKFDAVYTVFAGGDDFSFIGPHRTTQRFVGELRRMFSEFTARNPEIHFSAGMTVGKPGTPVRRFSELAEEALEEAKASGRNAVCVFGSCMPWSEWDRLREVEDALDRAAQAYELSTAYLYSLFELIDLAGRKDDPKASIWRSRLYYRTTRLMETAAHQGCVADPRRSALELIGFLSRAIDAHGAKLRVPLTNLFYRIRRAAS